MKNIYTLLLLTLSLKVFAQIPANYYNNATGTGYVLKTQLYNIINGHTDQGYGGLYTTYLTSDKDFYYENNGTLLDMYTENPTGTECEFTYGVNQDNGSGGTAECQKYNREHIIPQSVFSSQTPMYSDAHFVVPSDKYVNGVRGNFPMGRVGTANFTSTNGSKRGSNLNSGYSAGYTSTVFEPIDEFKGDIARMFFYFATRYQNQVASWTYDMFNGTSNQVFTDTFLNILLSWHNLDPVSTRELDRNNAIYARQNNRNPFIDHPEYVCEIYTAACDALSVNDVATFNVSMYPNPTNGSTVYINSTNQLTKIDVINLTGQVVNEITNPISQNDKYTVDNLTNGVYFVRLMSQDKISIQMLIVN